jgi:micrococcal nuclease
MRPSITSPEHHRDRDRPGAAHAPWRKLLLPLLAAFFFGVGGSALAGERLLRGSVSHVTDGDSVWVRLASGGPARPVRLRGIDAPEICQRHGAEARRALLSKVLAQPVLLRARGRDVYQRVLGEVATPGVADVGAWMVAQGHAWSPGYRGRPGPYAAEEAQARAGRRGLWAEPGAVDPRRFRRRHGSCH